MRRAKNGGPFGKIPTRPSRHRVMRSPSVPCAVAQHRDILVVEDRDGRLGERARHPERLERGADSADKYRLRPAPDHEPAKHVAGVGPDRTARGNVGKPRGLGRQAGNTETGDRRQPNGAHVRGESRLGNAGRRHCYAAAKFGTSVFGRTAAQGKRSGASYPPKTSRSNWTLSGPKAQKCSLNEIRGHWNHADLRLKFGTRPNCSRRLFSTTPPVRTEIEDRRNAAKLVDLIGIKPTTSSLRTKRSIN